MTVSAIPIADAESPDRYLHAYTRTIGGTAREDQVFQLADTEYPTYIALANNVSTATGDDHLMMLMGDGTSYIRVKRFVVQQSYDFPASAAYLRVALYRLTTAGSGGGTVTARPYDAADAAYGGTIQTLPSSKGTEGTLLWAGQLYLPVSPGGASSSMEWRQEPTTKPIVIGASADSGLAWKVTAAVASATVDVRVLFTTTSYL